MAETKVNEKVTDAVTQANVSVVGAAPAMAMGSLYQSLAFSMTLASLNAVYAQQQANMAHQVSTIEGVALLLSLNVE